MPMNEFDGKTSYHSTDRALVYVDHTALRIGSSKLGIHATPRRIRELAESHGEIVDATVFMEPNAQSDENVHTAWVGEGFKIAGRLPDKVKHGKGAVVIKSSMYKTPIHAIVEKDARNLRPNIVIFVGANEFPPSIFGTLKSMGVRTVVYNTQRGGQIGQLTNATLFLGDVSDEKPLTPTSAEEPPPSSNGIRTLLVYRQPPPREPILRRLKREDPDVHDQLARILNVSAEDVDSELDQLHRQTADGMMRKTPIVLAALLTLAAIHDLKGTAILDKDRLYRRFTTYGVPVDVSGRNAIRLLTEEGAFNAIEYDEDTDYVFTGKPDDPPHHLAYLYCRQLILVRDQLVLTDSSSSYSDQLLQAIKTFWSDWSHLTRKGQAILIDWKLLLMTNLTNGDRMRAYRERGLDFNSALLMERRIREILGIPTPDPNEEEDECGESDSPKPNSRTLVMPGLAKATNDQPRTKNTVG